MVITKPSILRKTENKVYQMIYASKYGWSIPKSYIGNDEKKGNEYTQLTSIIKPLTTGKTYGKNGWELYQTNIFKGIKEDISLTPIYLQQYIRKQYEVRITIIAREVYAVRIDTKNKIDWRLDYQNHRYVSYNKINAFTTIIVAVIPIAIALVNWDTIFSLNLFGIFIFIWLIYANINLYAWIFQAINVRGFMASTFGDLKKSTEKQKEQTWQIYYDWQQSKRKADMYVSFVLNIKIWIITVIILTIIFSVFLPFSKKSVIVPFDEDNAYTLDANLIESTYDKSAADWYLILM